MANLWGVRQRVGRFVNGKLTDLVHADGFPALFHTRAEAINWVRVTFGPVKKTLRQKDCRWRMPYPERVEVKFKARYGNDR